jgi:hypothetical protein
MSRLWYELLRLIFYPELTASKKQINHIQEKLRIKNEYLQTEAVSQPDVSQSQLELQIECDNLKAAQLKERAEYQETEVAHSRVSAVMQENLLKQQNGINCSFLIIV